jgi:glycosyltransferase 2 family protein
MVPGGKAKVISLTIAGVLAAVLLYYSLRGIEWRLVAHIIARARPGGLALTAGIGTLTLFLRACRWRILLNAEGTVRVDTAFWATAAGYFGNNFLPARAGELVRSFMISSRAGLDGAFVLATALAERAADAVALVVISAAVLLTLPDPPAWLSGAARPFALLALVAALGIAVLPLLGSVGRTAIERAPLPHSWRPRLIELMEHALRGLRAFHDTRRLSGFLALTAIIWCLDALGAVITASALGLRMPFAAAFLLIASLGLGSALPSTPGYVGIYQFVAVTVLGPFGFSPSDAIAYILVAQALNYVVIGLWGSIGILRYRRARRAA